MFERLESIVRNNERYESDADLPEVFVWFPMEKNYIPPALINEPVDIKTDRLVKLAKKTRSQLNRVVSGLEVWGEERLLEYMEVRENVAELKKSQQECQNVDQKVAEKSQGPVGEIVNLLEKIDADNIMLEILQENYFRVGMEQILTPWLTDLEKLAFKKMDKPGNIEEAREQELKAVEFAKEVRKANKMLSKLQEIAAQQTAKKLFCNQRVEDEKLRLGGIARSAASRVEESRNLLLNWNYYLERKTDVEKMLDALVAIFPDTDVSSKSKLDENDFRSGLPNVMLPLIEVAEKLVSMLKKPESRLNARMLQDQMVKLDGCLGDASNLMGKIESCTEKTPDHQNVWKQRNRLQTVCRQAKDQMTGLGKLLQKWETLVISEKVDNMDLQPLLAFLQSYAACFG